MKISIAHGGNHWQDEGSLYFPQQDPTLDTGCIFINKYINSSLLLNSHAAIHKVSIIWISCGHRAPPKTQKSLVFE